VKNRYLVSGAGVRSAAKWRSKAVVISRSGLRAVNSAVNPTPDTWRLILAGGPIEHPTPEHVDVQMVH
jgi:hypothetical protein